MEENKTIMPVRTPSPSSHRGPEADTIRKCRFYHAIDVRGSKPIKEICIQENVPERTGRYWLHQRSVLGNAANRRTGKYRSGRKQKVSDKHLDQLLDQDNPVRDQHYECQIDHFNIPVHPRTLRRALISRPNARRYKMAVVKTISEKNKKLRLQYGNEHHKKSIDEFWAYIHWTDEAHVDPTEVSS